MAGSHERDPGADRSQSLSARAARNALAKLATSGGVESVKFTNPSKTDKVMEAIDALLAPLEEVTQPSELIEPNTTEGE